jgi:cob(I)alamin adenosyltransferase
MKIYTKTGDLGDTGLFGGPRVRKDDLRIEAYGTVDELNAVLGLARSATAAFASRLNEGDAEGDGDTNARNPALAQDAREKLRDIEILLTGIQHTLFELGAELATPDPKARGTNYISTAEIEALESAIDRYEADLPPLKTFVLPGGVAGAAWLHLARTVCRRAERRVVTLMDESKTETEAASQVAPEVLIYLNRLSDLLFVLARGVNHITGVGDIAWQKPGTASS